MTKEERIAKVKEVIAAPSCCQELKDVSEAYLAAIDTDGEKAAQEKLIAELKDDICTIDEVIELFGSEMGAEFFGKEQALNMLDAAKKVKAAGGTTCFCPACTAGKALLDSFGA